MIEKLLNQMRLQAQMMLSNVAFTSMGTLANYDPINYMVKVLIEPQDPQTPNQNLTGWIPLLSPWVGNNWGMFAPPTLGATCVVLFSDGSFGAPIAAQMVFNNINRPLAVDSGEFWLVHQSGSALKFTNDGNVSLTTNSTLNATGTTVNVQGTTVNVDGDSVNLGKISAGSLQKLLLESASTIYNTHTHASTGAPPVPLMTAADISIYTEAN